MKLFRRAETSPTPPLTRDRVEALLKAQGWTYYLDSDGDLGGMWEGNHFHFRLHGEESTVFLIQGRWHDTVDFDMLDDLRRTIESWNTNSLWPKAYHRISDNGRITVMTDVAIDWSDGVTDGQILTQLTCAIATSIQLFSHIESTLDV